MFSRCFSSRRSGKSPKTSDDIKNSSYSKIEMDPGQSLQLSFRLFLPVPLDHKATISQWSLVPTVSGRYVKYRDGERTFVFLAQRKRRQEEGKKDRAWLNNFYRKDSKMEEPEAEAENQWKGWNIVNKFNSMPGNKPRTLISVGERSTLTPPPLPSYRLYLVHT